MLYFIDVEIFRTTLFLKAIKKLGASDAELSALEAEIVGNPFAGDVIPGLKGIRKIRFAMSGKGKSGGGRCVYVTLHVEDRTYLLLAYAKSQQADLTQQHRKALLAILEEIL